MRDFYNAFYAAVEHSPAHHTFCERVFGNDLGQHGFVDMEQLEMLIQATQPGSDWNILDLGCGNGKIAEYISDRTRAHVTGLDIIPLAISQAQQRTSPKSKRLAFQVGDINCLDLPDAAYDLILLLDSIYFSEDYAATIGRLKAALKIGGQMAFFYSYGREPWMPIESFPKELLPPDKTPLAAALQANRLIFRTWDLTRHDYALAIHRKDVLEELKPQFEVEALGFIYENRLGDANGISQAIEAGLHVRYLYLVQQGPG